MSARDVIAKWSASKADRVQDIPYYDKADLILAALDKAGFAVVPKEPTEAMKKAAFNVMPNDVRCATIWAVMLHAAKSSATRQEETT